MRTIKHVIISAALMLGLAIAANADDSKQAEAAETKVELKNQTHCPVMGGKIDSTVYTDIQGQRVYHCCPMCSAKLKENPDKYFKDAAAKGIVYENIQTTCPVSDHELKDKSVMTAFEGRQIAFCSEKCMASFNEKPAEYLKKLDKATEKEAEAKEKHDHDHEHGDDKGHTH